MQNACTRTHAVCLQDSVAQNGWHTGTRLPFCAGGAVGVGAALLLHHGLLAREAALVERVRHVDAIFFRVLYVLLQPVVRSLVKRRRDCYLYIPA